MIANPILYCCPEYHPEILFPGPKSPEHKPYPVYSTLQAYAGGALTVDLEQGAEWSGRWTSYLP